jgi:phosphate transport system permease protein
MADSPQSFATTGRSRKGEPLVWLTAAGLSLGVALIVGLLTLVVVKGFSSFWPERLVTLDHTADGEATQVAGYIVQERTRRDADGIYHEEIQLFRGNSEIYNQERFVFLDRENVSNLRMPDDLVLVERLEGGHLIGRLKSLKTGDGSVLRPGESGFDERLEEMLDRGQKLRAELKRVEKTEIGRNSKETRELEDRRRIEGDSPEIERRLAELREEFAALDAERKRIEQRAEAWELDIAASNERAITVPGDELLHVLEPNRLGFFGRLAETGRRIWNFLSMDPREANMEGGVYPAIFGTVVMTLIMSVFVTPFGVIAAIYLREYAKQGPMVRAVRISVNNLAGVPSIVFGVFGLAFFVYFVGDLVDGWFYPNSQEPVYKSGGILWASLTLALLTVPVVVVATEEALAAVPRGMREAALASGASKWQMIQRVVLPASVPGILTGVILAMARGAGEVAPLMLVGVVKLAPDLPIDGEFPYVHPERQFMHLGFHIYDLGFQSPDSEAAKPMVFATTLLLITLVVTMNLLAIVVRNHLRKKYATSSF